jgi:carnitine O-acetyltransferase
VIECGSDYRKEAPLEKYIGRNLYSNQKKMPKLPVPDVKDTVERLIPSALPLARNEKEAKNFKAAAAKFASQVEHLHLQEKLLARKAQFDKDNSSWLQYWWNHLGYMTYRDPVLVYVSYYFHLADDATVPSQEVGKVNVHRAAALVYAMSEFRELICSGNMPAETIGKKGEEKPICATAYKYMFHSCRIPRENEDIVRIYDPSRHKHFAVARKGHFFAVDFLDENGHVLPLEVIEQRLAKCIEIADSNGKVPYELGWLTGTNRDDWTSARNALTKNGSNPTMVKALEKLESAAILINFDDAAPTSRTECAELFLYGGNGGNSNQHEMGYNRWMDKAVQFSVTDNGKVGLIGEHALMDGMPMVNFANHVTKKSYAEIKKKSDAEASAAKTDDSNAITNIFEAAFKEISNDKTFHDSVVSITLKGKKDYLKLINAHTIQPLTYQEYGSDYIKKCGYSPDAFVQVAMQLATYRLFGEQVGTYESTQVRSFLHGRTEVTRAVSEASSKFIKAMGLKPKHWEFSDPAKNAEKLQLLSDAVSSHVEYMKNAAKGQGVDRHLFGLSMIASEAGVSSENRPDLLNDPVFIRSKTWRVSTSHLTHPKFDNWGYGEVDPNGVGLSYSIHPRHCQFSITALKETHYPGILCNLLEEALSEIKTLVEASKKDESTPIQSKL